MWAIYILCTIASYTYVCQPLEFQSSLLRFKAAAELYFNNFRVQIFSELVNGKIQLYHAFQTLIFHDTFHGFAFNGVLYWSISSGFLIGLDLFNNNAGTTTTSTIGILLLRTTSIVIFLNLIPLAEKDHKFNECMSISLGYSSR